MITEVLDIDDSLDSPLLQQLTSQQKIRLTSLLDDYLQSLERGTAVDTECLLQDDPALKSVFDEYLSKLQAIYGLANHQKASLPQDELSSLQQLGDFEVVREVGRGGMGVVYEAQQISMRRRVALKMLSLSSALDPRQIARFHNESRAAGMLQHPNIVPVYCVGVHQGIHYYAMQMIEGQSVDRWIEQQRQLLSDPQHQSSFRSQWKTVVQWCIQIGEALHVAHEAGIVHRDVKPSNLLLDQPGQIPGGISYKETGLNPGGISYKEAARIWITDFGLARCNQEASTTKSGMLVGTLRYMSPEQATGRSALVDARADVYGLAVSLYEMLTLQPAIGGDDAPTILKQVSEGQIQPLRLARRDVPRSLDLVLSKAMSKDRQQRYETALDFSADLRRVLLNEPTIARPATVLEACSNWAIRHQRAVLASACFVSLLVIGLLISVSTIAAQKRQTELIASRNAINERLAREAVDRLGAQMAERLVNIPAASSVRKQLLEETLSYYQQYAANAQHSPDLRRSLGLTLGKIGVLQGELGNSESAINALRESEMIFQGIAKSSGSDLQAQMEWATSLNNLGQALHRSSDPSSATELLEKAIALQSELAEFHDSSELKLQTATSLCNLGLLLADQGAIEKAEKAYQESVQLLEHDNAAANQIQLATVLTNLSRMLSKTRPDDAIEVARRALKIEVAALELEPTHARLSKLTSQTLAALAAAQMENKQYDDAINAQKQAVEIGQQLVSRWPEQPDYRSDLAMNLNQLGVAFTKLNLLADAQKVFGQALDLQRNLATQFPDEPEVQSVAGSMLNNFAFLCQQLQQTDQAIEAFEDAVKFQTRALQLAPNVSRYEENLHKHQNNLRSALGNR